MMCFVYMGLATSNGDCGFAAETWQSGDWETPESYNQQCNIN